MNIISLINENKKETKGFLLLEFIAEHYQDLFNLEILEVKNSIKIGNESTNQKIVDADGIIILTNQNEPVYSSVVEYLVDNAQKEGPSLKNIPILVMSENTYNPESSASQLQVRELVETHPVNASTFPGTDFFLGEIMEEIAKDDSVINKKIMNSLRESFINYVSFVKEIGQEEDLFSNKSIHTTIDGLDKHSDDWFEQAVDKVNPVEGNTYIKLDRGVLTVDQLNSFLKSMPMELTFMDANNQFLYYNYYLAGDEMLASTYPEQVGSPVGHLHPEAGHKRVKMLIQQLRSGKQETFKIHVPTHGPDKFVVHHYTAMRNNAGKFMGVNEFVLDLQPVIDWYLKQTNQQLSKKPEHIADAVSGATARK